MILIDICEWLRLKYTGYNISQNFQIKGSCQLMARLLPNNGDNLGVYYLYLKTISYSIFTVNQMFWDIIYSSRTIWRKGWLVTHLQGLKVIVIWYWTSANITLGNKTIIERSINQTTEIIIISIDLFLNYLLCIFFSSTKTN